MKEINFIGIGAQKSGTSWIYHRLLELDEFSLPYIKELHYFDRDPKYPSPIKISKSQLKNRIFEFTFINNALQEILSALYRRNWHKFLWMCNWHLSTYNDAWYLSLFNKLSGIRGEITPAYSILEEEDIKKMYALAPNAKIIFIIRNPIERAWSQFRFHLKNKNQENNEISEKEIIRFMNHENQTLRSNYLKTLELYSNIFPKNNICVAFYDAIIEQPEELLAQIVNQLGGDISKIQSECNIYSKTNTSKERQLPDSVKKHLIKKYRPLIEKLSKIFSGYPKVWEDKLNNTIGSSHPNYPIITLDKIDFYK